jgi:hypothetical protein
VLTGFEWIACEESAVELLTSSMDGATELLSFLLGGRFRPLRPFVETVLKCLGHRLAGQ